MPAAVLGLSSPLSADRHPAMDAQAGSQALPRAHLLTCSFSHLLHPRRLEPGHGRAGAGPVPPHRADAGGAHLPPGQVRSGLVLSVVAYCRNGATPGSKNTVEETVMMLRKLRSHNEQHVPLFHASPGRGHPEETMQLNTSACCSLPYNPATPQRAHDRGEHPEEVGPEAAPGLPGHPGGCV